MRISDLFEGRLNPANFDAVMNAGNIQSARDAALKLLHGTTTNPQKMADMRDMVMAKGTKDEILKLLWKWYLSLDGMPTGISTQKGRKGLGYPR